MKWVRIDGGVEAKSGRFVARVDRVEGRDWVLRVERTWFDPVRKEDRCKVLSLFWASTQAKAKAAGEALIGIIGGEP